MKLFLLSLSFFFLTLAQAQSGLVIITSEISDQLTTCLDSSTFTVEIENPSPFTLTEMTFELDLPTGVTYVPGTVSGATEMDIADLSHPDFSVDSVFTLTTASITFKLIASCEVIDFISGGGIIENDVHINFNANDANYDDYHTSATYVINQPNLVLLDFTNQSYSGSVGDVYDRCMTFINSGSGALSTFAIADVHGPSINISGTSLGTLVTGVGVDSIYLTGADFATIGDMDTLFDPGESIVICETVEILECFEPESGISYSWGCEGSSCQTLTSSANVVFPGEIPNLSISVSNDYGTCLGEDGEFSSTLSVLNEGTGTAYNVLVEIAQGSTSHPTGYAGMYSTFDTSSFTGYLNGDLIASGENYIIDSTLAASSRPCLPDNPLRKLFIVIDSLVPGDTIRFEWDWFTCCYDYGCTPNSRKHMLSWNYKPTYYNRCGQEYTDIIRLGHNWYYFRQYMTGTSPDNIFDGESGTFSFENNNYEYHLPRDTDNDLFRYEVIIPPCLSYDPGTFSILNFEGDGSWTPFSTIVSGDTINFYFDDLPTPWGLAQGTTSFDLSLDCGLCGTGTYEVSLNVFYSPDTTCTSSCEKQFSCETVEVNLICPEVCPGINFTYINQERGNYGEPDSDNNGLADGVGTVDLSLIRTDRLSYGDTLRCRYESYVSNTAGVDTWPYFYVRSEIFGAGNRMSYADNMTLTIYDASTGFYHSCDDVVIPTEATGGTTRTFKYEFIVADLIASGCLPGGYFLDDGDSVLVDADLVVSNNPGGSIIDGSVENQFYASDIADPDIDDVGHIFGCPELLQNFSIVGYYFTNWGPNDLETESCDNVILNQNYYLSIGPCCGNYAGGNLYPYEYRYWAHPSELRVVLPDSYDYVSARFNFRRTAGTFVTSGSPWFDLTPDAIVGEEYTFDVSDYFGPVDDPAVDSIYFGDDGFYGTLQVVMAPNCTVEGDTTKKAAYYWSFDVTDQLVGSNTLPLANNTTHDGVRYEKPTLQLQCDLPTINVTGSTAVWNLEVGNTSISSDAHNAWLGLPTISSVIADSIYDVSAATFIYPTPTGIFPIGDVNAGDFKDYTVYAHFLSCSVDSIKAHLGWNCTEVPDDLESYPCETEEIMLVETPLMPRIANYVEVEGSDTLDLCDSTVIFITVENVQLGNAFDLNVEVTLPEGMHFYAGSSEFLYPLSDAFEPIGDPTFVIGNTWNYNITATDDSISLNGLHGLLDTALNKLQIKLSVYTNCDYVSGSRIFVNSEAYAGCGALSDQITGLSEQLFILDALPPYDADLFITTTYLTPCLGGTEVEFSIVNNGPLAFGEDDSVRITLDPFITFIDDSFIGILNPPADPDPTISDVGGSQLLEWKLPEDMDVGDTCRFSIEINGDPANLSCGINQINAQIISSGTAICVTDGSICDIDIASGDTVRNIFVYKGYLELSASESFATYDPPTGETAFINFTISNTGETISEGTETIIRFYDDTDGSSSYTIGDILVETDTITDEITGGGAFDYDHSFAVPYEYTCELIAVISTEDNPCSCISTQLIIPMPLVDPTDTISVCTGFPEIIGGEAVDTYGYEWSPGTDLSSSFIAQPTFTGTAIYPDTDTIEYVRTVDRGGCFGYDTTIVINYSLPVSDAGVDQDLCAIYTTDLEGNIALGTSNGMWTTASGPAAVTYADPTLGTTTISDLVEGTYELVWTVSNGTCPPITDTVIINVYDAPVSDAGIDQNLCAIYTTDLAGNVPAGTATGLWTTASGPGAVTYTDPTLATTNISGLVEGTYELVWTVSNGTCPPETDTMVINVYDAPVSDAGVDQDLCAIYTTDLEGNVPAGTATGLWTTASGPGAVTYVDPTIATTNISGLVEGTYELVWTVSNGTCPPVTDTVIINVYDAPTSDAGPNQNLCAGYSTFLEGNIPAGTATGLWTTASGPGAVTYADPTLATTNISDLIEGTYELVWTVSNGTCPPETDTVIINVYDLPVSDAGADQELCAIYTTALDGNVPAGTAYGLWTTLSGPGAVTFTDPTVANTTISGLVEGTYELMWTVSNGTCPPATDTVLIHIYDAPISDAGADQDLCATYTTDLEGNIPAGTATGLWTTASGPGAVTYADPTLATTNISGLVEGTYELVWTVSNGTCPPVTDTVVINVYDAPISDAGADQDLCATYTTDLDGNIPAGTATGLWTTASGPGAVIYTDPTLATTNISGLVEGTYELVWTVSNGTCPPVTDTVVINVYDAPVSNAGPDQELCAIYTTDLAGNVPAGTSTGLWTTASGPAAVTYADPTLATTNISGLVEGTYELVWTMSNGTCPSVTDTVTITVYDTPVSDAGPDQELCATYTTDLEGNVPAGTSTGLWTTLSGPAAVTYTDPTSATTTISDLMEGTYELIWTVSNGTCPPATDTVIVTVYDAPVSDAGTDQELCSTYATDLEGNIPAGTSTGLWTTASGPGAVTYVDPTIATTNISGLVEGTYELVWTVSNGTCPPATDTVLIHVYDAPVSDAGTDQELCATYTTDLEGNIPVGTSSGLWITASGPGVVTYADPTVATTNISGMVEGTYELVWTVSNGTCPPATDTVIITIYDTPVSDAGPDQDLCATYTTDLEGNIPAGTATGLWTTASGPGAVTYTDPTVATTNISGLVEGTYELVWTVSNGPCPPVTDTVVINVYDAPVSNAGTDQELCATYTTDLNGNIPAGTATGLWTTASGPGAVTYADPTLATTNISGLVEGTYELVWTVSNGTCTPATDTVIITVYDAPASDAGPDQDLCATYTTNLDGNIPAGTATGLWTTFSGPGTVTYVDPSMATTNISGLVEGTYELIWTVSNGTCPPVTDTVVINVYDMPVSNAGPDQSLCEIFTVDLDGSVPTGTSDGAWSMASGPAACTFVDETDPATQATDLIVGTYDLVWTVSNGTCPSATDTVTITINPYPIINFMASEVQGCDPQEIAFANLSAPIGDACVWDFGDGTTVEECGDVIHTYTEGTYDVTLTVTANGCTASETYTDYITIYPYPEAAFEIHPNFVDMTDPTVNLENLSNYADTYEWNFGDGSPGSNDFEPNHTYPEVGNMTYTITLIAENSIGCPDTAYGTVIVEDVILFYVPNAFTPDGTGRNDMFYPVFASGFDPYDYHLQIFNRWGESLFESYDVNTGWDGSYDNVLVQDGVYIWVIEFGDAMSDERHIYRGHITVLK